MTVVNVTENDIEQTNWSGHGRALPCGACGAQGSFSYTKTLLRIHKLGDEERLGGGNLWSVSHTGLCILCVLFVSVLQG